MAESSNKAHILKVKIGDKILIGDCLLLIEDMTTEGVTFSYDAGVTDSLVFVEEPNAYKSQNTKGWPRFWNLAGYFLPRPVRERVYEPAHAELLEDYIESKRFRTKWSKRWLNLCFIFKTLLLLADCWRALLTDKAFQLILMILPVQIREWWSRPRL